MSKCKYYDDGVGNGGYCSGMNAGPPACNLSKDYIRPKCGGDFKKCEVDSKIAEINSGRIRQLEQELEALTSRKY